MGGAAEEAERAMTRIPGFPHAEVPSAAAAPSWDPGPGNTPKSLSMQISVYPSHPETL